MPVNTDDYAKVAAERKNISIEEARKQIEEIKKKYVTPYRVDLALRHYLEDHHHHVTHKRGTAYGVDPIDHVDHHKE